MSTKPCAVMALMDVPSLVSQSEKEGLTLNKTTKTQLISCLLNVIGPYFGYGVIQEMMRKKLHHWAKEDFEVDKILDHTKEEDGDYYLIKWKEWSSDFNSWEKKENLSNCSELLEAFEHQRNTKNGLEDRIIVETRQEQLNTILNFLKERYYDDLLREFIENVKGKKRITYLLKNRKSKLNGKLSKTSRVHKLHQAELKKSFDSWIKEISRGPDFCPIYVQNEVDMEGLPSDFVYISRNFLGNNVTADAPKSVGCKCRGGDCGREKRSCCGASASYRFAYNKAKRLRISEGEAIYECNEKCSCDESCPNRVVQFGREIPLCLFRTKDGRGWGVKATRSIRKGTFVEEYVGEIITSEEAEKRGQTYDAEGLSYLFDLDFHGKDCAFTVDAKTYGNISHFINHSCDPNLAIFNVWIDNHDDRLPRLALFAIRNIKANEELTFDYKMDARDSSMTSENLPDELQIESAIGESLSSESISYFPTLQDQPCAKVHPSGASDSPISFVTANNDSSDCKIFSKVENGSMTTADFIPIPEKPVARVELYVPYRSDTPSASSASMNDAASKAGGDSSDLSGRALRSRSRKRRAETSASTLKTECWVKSGGLSTRPKSGNVTTTKTQVYARSRPADVAPVLKRLKIPCNCGTSKCRKWLC